MVPGGAPAGCVTTCSLVGCRADAAGRDGDEVLLDEVRAKVDYRSF